MKKKVKKQEIISRFVRQWGENESAKGLPVARTGLAKMQMAKRMRYCRTRARRQLFCRQPDAFASGETEKKTEEKARFLSRPFLIVFIGLSCCFLSFPQLSCGNNFGRYDCMSHTGCRGNTPAAGYRGCVSPCLAVGVQGARGPCFVFAPFMPSTFRRGLRT